MNKKVNIEHEVKSILTAVQELQKAYGISYLIQILRGREDFELRQVQHAELSAFGSLVAHTSSHIRNLINYLVEEEHLRILNARYGLLGLAEKGKAFLETPSTWEVSEQLLRLSRYDWLLSWELREIRKELSEKDQRSVFEIFNDYTLHKIVRQKPYNIETLRAIPGIGEYKINRYGHLILGAISRVEEKRKQESEEKLLRKISSPSYQEVKALFTSGLEPRTIAERRKVKEETIYRILFGLHNSSEIDLIPWIENHLPQETLSKGTDYFIQSESQRLKPAHEALGIPYDMLKLCRLYAFQQADQQEQMAVLG